MYIDKETRIQQEKQLVGRWDWLTDGIEDYDTKLNTSIVLENSYDSMIAEGQVNPGWLESTILNEDSEMLNEAPVISTSVGSNLIPKVLFPVIRRVYPSLIANKLVSVQPIQARTGVIYYMTYTYTNTKGEITAADEYSGVAQQGLPAYSTWYSSEKIGPFTGTVSTVAGDSTTITATSAKTFFAYTADTVTLKRIEVYNTNLGNAYSGVSTAAIQNGYSPWGSLGTANVFYDLNAGAIRLRKCADSTAATGLVPWKPGQSVAAYIVYNQEGSQKIPEMEFSIGSDTVDTTERKLKIRWTKEAEQDMKSYHKIDVESELVKMASMEMNYEIDREIIQFTGDQVVSDLSILHDWTADSPNTGNNTSGNYLDRHRALTQKIYQVSAKIAQYNRLGPASWAVVSPQVAALLAMLPDFKGEIAGGTFAVFEAGQLGSGLKIFVDPNRYGTIANEILLGYKNTNTSYGAGVVYAPYTNWISGLVTDPNNFNSVRGFFTRYALKKVPRGQWYYGKVSLTNYGI
jgi:hypothetical protein